MDGFVAAHPLKSAFLQYAQQLNLHRHGHIADFVQKRVPPSAISKRPCRVVKAPVNAPFSCPNSSLSSNSPGIAPQLIGTNGLSLRKEASCKAGQPLLSGSRLAQN